jgi:inorganic pyrophosphatase
MAVNYEKRKADGGYMPCSEPYQGNLIELATFDAESENLNVIVDTPKGSRNKFKYAASLNLFKLGSMLPAGISVPFDFGFIPSTEGGD